jgi:TetR/AcrR family transcriptional regulator, fatty acid metabolism regulator protein
MNKVKFSKRKLQGQETKRRLMNYAITLFREKGYHNVTVDEIIETAGSSKGGFYTHFSSKEELLYNLVALLDEAYTAFPGLHAGGCSAEKIAAFIDYVFRTIEENIGLEFIKVIYASQIKDMAPERFAVTPQRKYYQILEKMIQDGLEKQEIRAGVPAEHIIRLLTTGIRGVLYDWCLGSGNFDLARYGKEVTGILLQQFLTPP